MCIRDRLCRDGMLRLAANVRERPEQWLSRLIFLLGPWVSFWMVEILNGNDVFSDLYSWPVSYTHLDVYKRQHLECSERIQGNFVSSIQR